VDRAIEDMAALLEAFRGAGICLPARVASQAETGGG
jgi:hypothetical protein